MNTKRRDLRTPKKRNVNPGRLGMIGSVFGIVMALALTGVPASADEPVTDTPPPATAEVVDAPDTGTTVDETQVDSGTDTGTTDDASTTEEVTPPAAAEAVVETVADTTIDTSANVATQEVVTSPVTETPGAAPAAEIVEVAAVAPVLPVLSYTRLGGYDVRLTLTGGDSTTYTDAVYTVNHSTDPDVSSFPPVTGPTQVVTTASVPGQWDIYMTAKDLDGNDVATNVVAVVLPYEAVTPDISSLEVFQCYGFTTSFGVVGGNPATYQPNSFGLAWDLNGQYAGEKLVAVDTLPTILPEDYEAQVPGLWTVRPFVTSLQGERAYGEATSIQLPDCKDPEPVDDVIPVPPILGPEYTDDDSTVKGDVVWNADKVATASDAVNTWFVAPNGDLFSKPTAANTTYPNGVLEFNHGKPTDVYVPPVVPEEPCEEEPGEEPGDGGPVLPGTPGGEVVAVVTPVVSKPTSQVSELPATGGSDLTGLLLGAGVLGGVGILFRLVGRRRDKLATVMSTSTESDNS